MNINDISYKELHKLYVIDNLSSIKIAKLLNCSKTTILKKLSKFSIKRKSISEARKFQNRKYTKNENYFSTPNINNSYWAGFIAADGCIGYYNNAEARLCFGCQTKDEILLNNFKNDINYTGQIIRINKNISTLSITSNKIAKDLNKYWNITPKKSLTLKPPNLTNKEEILSYIIGYIDGDGCISFEKNRYLRLSLIGTKEILIWINNEFSNSGCLYKQRLLLNNTYNLTFSGKKAEIILKTLYNHILKFNILTLERKWNKIKNV